MGTAESLSMTKPVFNDETGRRAAVLLWVGRAVITVCAILGVAIAFTLTTHIALPGLDGLVSPTLNGDQPEVALPTDTHKRVAHPAVGVMELDCQILTAENQTEKLVVFTVSAGTEDAERLALLSMIGTETFAAAETVEADATG